MVESSLKGSSVPRISSNISAVRQDFRYSEGKIQTPKELVGSHLLLLLSCEGVLFPKQSFTLENLASPFTPNVLPFPLFSLTEFIENFPWAGNPLFLELHYV